MPVSRYPSEQLRRFIAEVLIALGLSPGDAATGATVLHDADLAGVDTHGIVSLPRHDHYAKGLRSGQVDPAGEPTVLRDAPTAAAWDSGRGFGPVVAQRAMQEAIDKAVASGIGMVSVRDGRHFGANGYFAEMAARQGLVAMVAANTPVVGVPPGALRPVVGTNPFAFAAPMHDAPPMVLDMAMTATSGSRVLLAGLAGESVPEGWVVDASGEPTTAPVLNRSGGGLELLGGRVAGHKGFALALMVDALAILSGNGSGIWQSVDSTGWSQGQWFAAWRVDLFVDPADFAAELRRVAEYVHETPVKSGVSLVLPGERRAACRASRAQQGIPLADDLVLDLRRLASETGAEFPEAVSSR
jgi:LDH2 family malate/lactate/ureidoglycolate dehydrogenase